MDKNIFLDLDGFDGRYKVNCIGVVKSIKKDKEIILKQHITFQKIYLSLEKLQILQTKSMLQVLLFLIQLIVILQVIQGLIMQELVISFSS